MQPKLPLAAALLLKWGPMARGFFCSSGAAALTRRRLCSCAKFESPLEISLGQRKGTVVAVNQVDDVDADVV